MPEARCVRAATDGGALKGGAPRVVWQTLRVDPRLVSAHSAAQRLDQVGRPCHLVWNPLTGEIVQLIPILRAGCSLGGVDGLDHVRCAAADHLTRVNTEGRLCVQVSVVAFPWEPFTRGPMVGLDGILEWLDSWHIPRRWPAGSPEPFAHAHATPRSRRLWARGGHYGGSQVPECATADPGAVDVEKLTGVAVPHNVGLLRQSRAAAPTLARQARIPAGRVFEPEEPATASLARS
jgi:hypothetical protein